MSDEGFSTQEEHNTWTSECGLLPANLVRTIHFLLRGWNENTNNLIMMHHELNARWLLIVRDLRKLSGNQTILQSQIEAQATAFREAEANANSYQDLHDKITNLSKDLPDP
jgi:hypothetical protein